MSDFPNKEEVAAIMVLWKEQRARDYAGMKPSLEEILDGPIVCFKPYFDTLGTIIKNLEGLRKNV